MTEILLAVLVSTFLLLFLGCLGFWIYHRYRLDRQTVLQQKMLTAAVDRLSAHLESTTNLPQLVAGLTEVSKDQVGQLTELQDVVRKLGRLFARDGGEDYQAYDEQEADREYEIQQIQKAGISREGAEARVKDRDMWKRMTLNG